MRPSCFRPSIPGSRRRPPHPLETNPSSRLFRRRQRRRQVSCDLLQKRVQIKPPRPVEVVQVSQTVVRLIHQSDVLSPSASDPLSSEDRGSCIWAGTSGAGDMRCQVIWRVMGRVRCLVSTRKVSRGYLGTGLR